MSRQIRIAAKARADRGRCTCCRIDAALDIVLLLERAFLAGEQAENHDLSLRDEAKRFEAPGAFIIVFKEKAIHIQFVEHGLGDRIVARPPPKLTGDCRGRCGRTLSYPPVRPTRNR